MVAEIPLRYGEELDFHAQRERVERIVAGHGQFAGAGAAYLVAYSGEEVVGCGALRPLPPDTQGTGEINRMYVMAGWRRRGVGAAILTAIEEHARSCGYSELWLETGDLQHEAQALYAAAGYRRIPAFGEYAGDPTSICFAKLL
jgi:GNAT superfamily N-acetyltransferase